jgi:hypothetical protein
MTPQTSGQIEPEVSRQPAQEEDDVEFWDEQPDDFDLPQMLGEPEPLL